MNTRTLRRTNTQRARSKERGMSLVEALVAILIFSVAFMTAMMLYTTANRTYLRTDAAAVQQQNVRFALDRMSETLRDAGAGHNMLGSNRLADEQIEGAWQSAIVVRGDFDGARETDPNRESTAYPIITTGNDEIVGYVLRKADNSLNTIPLTVIADFTPTVRDAVYTSQNSIAGEETRTIMVAASNVAQQTDPPYRLERVTFDETTGNPKYEVVADNVFRLSFRYLEDDVTLEPIDFDTAIGGANAERDERGKVRRIEINLTGMTDRPDLGYKDETVYVPAVPEATKGHRKFTVSQTIYSPNLGIIGSRQNTTLPLDMPTPTFITACAGHCRTYLISWPASTNPGVTTYRLEITAPADAGLGLDGYVANEDVIGTSYEFQEPIGDIQANAARTFTFRVAPIAGPVVGAFTTAVARSSENPSESTPQDVVNVTAAQAATGINALRVTWDPVTTNTGVVSGSTCISAGSVSGSSAPPSPWNAKAADLKEARVYRRRFTGSNTGADVSVSDEVTNLELGELANDAGEGSFMDKTAAPCSAYFYRVKACDLCNVTSTNLSAPMNDPVQFIAATGVNPAKPSKPTPVGAVTFSGGNWNVQLEWAPVTRNTDDEQAAVAHYVLERWRRLGNSPNWVQEADETEHIYDALQSPVDIAPGQSGGETAQYRYYLKAVYDCPTPQESEPSDPYEIGCVSLTNTMAFTQPPNGDTITRPSETSVPISLVTTGTGWTSATLTISGPEGEYGPFTGTIGTNVITFPSWNVADDQTFIDGDYTLSVTAMVGECAIPTPATRTITLDSVACGQRIITTGASSWTGNGSNQFTGFNFRIENTCPFTVTFNALAPSWTAVSSVTRLTRMTSNSVTVFNNSAGIASGTTFAVSPSIVLAAASGVTPSLSPVMSFAFDDNFTNDATQNGTPGKFSSIVINVTSPATSQEQLVDATPVP